MFYRLVRRNEVMTCRWQGLEQDAWPYASQPNIVMLSIAGALVRVLPYGHGQSPPPRFCQDYVAIVSVISHGSGHPVDDSYNTNDLMSPTRLDTFEAGVTTLFC